MLQMDRWHTDLLEQERAEHGARPSMVKGKPGSAETGGLVMGRRKSLPSAANPFSQSTVTSGQMHCVLYPQLSKLETEGKCQPLSYNLL